MISAGGLPPLGAFPRRTRRADAVGPAADGQIVHQRHGRLFGIDHFQMLDPPLFQFPAHDTCQRCEFQSNGVPVPEERCAHSNANGVAVPF